MEELEYKILKSLEREGNIVIFVFGVLPLFLLVAFIIFNKIWEI